MKSFTVYCNDSAKTQAKALWSLLENLPVHNRSGKQKFQVLPSKKQVYRTSSAAQALPGTVVPVTGTKVSRTNTASCQNPLCRGTYSSKKSLCISTLPRNTRLFQVLYDRAAASPARLRVAPPPSHNCSRGPSIRVNTH